jgi:hypothetical protein
VLFAEQPRHYLPRSYSSLHVTRHWWLAREKWLTLGAVDLPGFVRRDVRLRMAAEVAPEAGLLAKHRLYTAPYLAHSLIRNVSVEDGRHPLRRQFQTDIHAVAADQVPADSLLRLLYDSRRVAAFFARVVGKGELFHYADPFQSLNVMHQFDAGPRSWHYDGSDFVTTVLLQKADEGGDFEFAPFIRGPMAAPTASNNSQAGSAQQQVEGSKDGVGKYVRGGAFDERFESVRALFDGAYRGTRLKTLAEPGSVQLFNGQRSLHRVRCVYGRTTRITAVLSYDTKPPCEQSTPSMESNVRNYGERVRSSPLWGEAKAERERICAAEGGAQHKMPPMFETEG